MTESIKKNYLYVIIYNILVIAVPFITIPYISRVIGPKLLGVQSYTTSIAYLFVVISTFGIFTLGQRVIAQNRDNKNEYSKVFWNIYSTSLLFITLSIIIWCIHIAFVDKNQLYYIILSINVISPILDITWFYIGFELFKKILIRNVLIKTIIVIPIFILVKNESDIYLYILILSISELLGNLSLWLNFRKRINRVNFNDLSITSYACSSFKYYIPSISLSIYILVDKIMIGYILGSDEDNGYYEQASKIILMIELLLLSLNNVMGPRMSYLFKKGADDEIKDKIKKSFDFLLLLSCPVVVGIWVISDNFVLLFLGEHFGPVSEMLCLMSPIPMLMCVSNILCLQYITPSGKVDIGNKIVVFGTVCNIIGNLILIHYIGVNGAIISSVVSELIISLLYVIVSKEYCSWKILYNLSIKRIISTIIMVLILLFVNRYIELGGLYTLLIQIFIGALTYFFVLCFLKDSLLLNIIKAIIGSLFGSFKKKDI